MVKSAEMLWELAEPGGQGPMKGGWIIGQGGGGRINLMPCDYISSIE